MATTAPGRLLETAALLAARDGQVDPDERSALERLAARLRLEPGAVDRALAAARERSTVVLPREPGERVAFFHDLCQVAAADGRLEPAELAFLRQVAARLEMPADELLQALAPLVADARRRRRPPWGAFLVMLGLFLVGVWATGWLSAFQGTVAQRRSRAGGRGHTYYSLQLQDGLEHDVPQAVHRAAREGSQVRKRLGAVWWSVDGETWFGGGAVGLVVGLLGCLAALGLAWAGRIEEDVHEVLIAGCTVTAMVGGVVLSASQRFGALTFVTGAALTAVVALSVRAWRPARRRR